jgi:predicted nucleic acid-binding protein
MVTTEWVLMELADALAAPTARSTAAALIESLRKDALFEIIGYVPELYEAGFQLYVARQDKAWSLTDCISFEAMNLRKLREALTADHHFEQAGFRAVFK